MGKKSVGRAVAAACAKVLGFIMKPQIKPIYLIISAALHVALVVVFSLQFARSSKLVQVPPALRVDVVALPDKVKPKLAKKASKKFVPAKAVPPKAVPPKAVPAKAVPAKAVPPQGVPAEVSRAKAQKKIKVAQNKALQKLDKMPSPQKANEGLESKVESEAEAVAEAVPEAAPVIKGQRVTSGDSLQGLERLRFDSYHAKLREHVAGVWSLPSWLSTPGLKAQIMIALDMRGALKHVELLLSSGNQVFDEWALQTVQRAVPLPPPPAQLDVHRFGFVLSFEGA